MKIKTIILLSFLLVAKNLFSQGGGPPMLTTDPGTPENNHWEINTSLNFQHSASSSIQLPTTEVVYGIGSSCQISVQLPVPNIELNKSHLTTFTQPQAGVKCRLLNEEQHFVSLSVYPQIIIPLYKEQTLQIFIPLELEKTFNHFRIGNEFGYFILNNPNTFFNGTIIGVQLKNDLELMSEFFFSKTIHEVQSTSGLINLGFRKSLNKHSLLMSSIGTQVITPYGEDRQTLFGLIGVQILLGK